MAETQEVYQVETPNPLLARNIPGGQVVTVEQSEHQEAKYLAFTGWCDPAGRKWNMTVREGATVDDLLSFISTLSLFGEAVSAPDYGWTCAEMRLDKARNGHETGSIKEAKHIVAQLAVELGIMSNLKDSEGGAQVVAIGKAADLEPGDMGTRMADWMAALVAHHDEAMAVELHPSRLQPAPAVQPTQVVTTQAPTQPVVTVGAGATAPTTTQPQTGETSFTSFGMVPTDSGKPQVKFYREGMRYPVFTYGLAPQGVLDAGLSQVRVNGHPLTVEDLQAGTKFNVAGKVVWKASDKLKSSGNPYLDLQKVVF